MGGRSHHTFHFLQRVSVRSLQRRSSFRIYPPTSHFTHFPTVSQRFSRLDDFLPNVDYLNASVITMDFNKLSDVFQNAMDRAQNAQTSTVVAVIGSGAVFFAGAYIYNRQKSKGYKAKPGSLELSGGNLTNKEVKKAFDGFKDSYGVDPGVGIVEKEQTPELVDTFYNLVTDFYEWGWGQSFHFSPHLPGKSWFASEVAHEARIACTLGLKPGMKCGDFGCGVGGPMRTIASVSGAEVVGVTINDYQVERANYHNRKLGVDALCKAVQGNFLHLEFPDNTFDGCYAIEATCHSPTLEEVYAEIKRVMKPGALFITYEWLTTDKFDATNPEHVKIIDDINYGNGLPDMRSVQQAEAAAKHVGLEIVESLDLATASVVCDPWYERLEKIAGSATWLNRGIVNVLSALHLLPKGVRQVHDMLLDAAAIGLIKGGQTGIFTPMHMIVLRKPAN